MTKNIQFLLYIIDKLHKTNITTIVKLSYFCDLSFADLEKKQISDYEYIRFYYGPFSQEIKNNVNELVKEGYLEEVVYETPDGKNYHEYELTDKILSFDLIDQKEMSLIDNVIEELSQLSAKQLGLLSYKTTPMIELGATPGGRESFREKLKLISTDK